MKFHKQIVCLCILLNGLFCQQTLIDAKSPTKKTNPTHNKAKPTHNKTKPSHNISNIHFIGTWYGGLLASVMCVLNHLEWCEKNNKTPIVYWDHRCHYYVPEGFNGSRNVWEYYFEPVSPLNDVPTTFINLEFTPGNTYGFTFCQDYLEQATRTKASTFIQKYIKLKPVVQQKIDRFYQQNMLGKKTIGIHLRGTDKGTEVKLVSPEKIIEIALQYAHEEDQFLIATDEQSLLDKMLILLSGKKVFYYPCYRSTNGQVLFSQHKKVSVAQCGEDVLVELSLLTKCDLLVHTLSNVSSFALYANPNLEHVLVL